MPWVYFLPQNRTYCICDTAELDVTELESDQQKMQIRFHGILADYSSCRLPKKCDCTICDSQRRSRPHPSHIVFIYVIHFETRN